MGRSYTKTQIKKAYLKGGSDLKGAVVLGFSGGTKSTIGARFHRLRHKYKIPTLVDGIGRRRSQSRIQRIVRFQKSHPLLSAGEIADKLRDSKSAVLAILNNAGLISVPELRKRRAEHKIQHLKGHRSRLGNKKSGQWVVATGKVVSVSLRRSKRYLPEYKCEYANHSLHPKEESSSLPYGCPECIKNEGGLKERARLTGRASDYGLGLDDYLRKRDNQRNTGWVLCAICGIAENGKLLGVDHDHRYTKKSGKGNRDLVCDGCNVVIVPKAEAILEGRAYLPVKTSGFGWLLLVKAIKYVENWDEKFSRPRLK